MSRMKRNFLIVLLTTIFLVACGDFPKLTIDTNAASITITNETTDINIIDKKEVKAIIGSFNKAVPIKADLDMPEHDYIVTIHYEDADDERFYLWLPADSAKAIIAKEEDTASG